MESSPFSDVASARLAALVTKAWGILVHEGNRRHVERAAIDVARDAGCSPEDLIAQLEKSVTTPLAQDFINQITIGETYFFRHQEHFAILRDTVLPEALKTSETRTKFRAWSAACSTGEEPYSIAMTLRPHIPPHVQLEVLGTDINATSLKKAEAGIFGRWSERVPFDTTLLVRNGDKLQATPQLRKMVRFARLNLADCQYPSVYSGTTELDVIFCRNVLVYFSSETAKAVLRSLAECLVPGGWMFTSALDIDLAPAHLTRWGFPDSTVILRRPLKAERPLKSKATKAPSMPVSPVETPVVPAIYVAEALRLTNAGLSDQAIAHLEENLNRVQDPSAIVLLALLLFERGDSAVLPLLKNLVQTYPHFVQGHLHLGFHLQSIGQAAEAQRCFTHILSELHGLEDQKVMPGPTDLPVGYIRRLVQDRMRRGGSGRT